jgi:hypothetical protein
MRAYDEEETWKASFSLACLWREDGTMPASTGNGASRGDVSRPQPAERITIALIPKAVEDLQRLQDRTGLSKTDITNRAITLYEFIDAQLGAGWDLLIRNKATAETQIIRLF